MDFPVTVLAVDDQPANLRLLGAVLTPRGHRVLTASSGAEALALLETEDVDLVLLDIVMPEMDGVQTLRELRAEDPAARIVMVSAVEQRAKLRECFGAGAADFVVKPFDKERLLSLFLKYAELVRAAGPL